MTVRPLGTRPEALSAIWAAPAVITKKAVQPVAPKVLVGKYVDERSPEVKEAAAVIAQAEAIGKPAPYDECCA